MEKIKINMLSMADTVEGQGVGSAYQELINLLDEGARDLFEVSINSRKRADIIHAHTTEPQSYIKMKLNKGINVAYCHFLPDTLNGSLKLPKIAFDVFKKYIIKFYNSADYLVVVNPIFIDDLVKYGIKRDKIIYIPNYVSKEKFFKKNKQEVKKIRKELGIDADKFVVLGAGQIQTRKGVVDFIKVAKKMPNIQFVWCGGFSFGKITDGYDELKEIVDNPPENVLFTGIIKRDKMNDMFNMSDLLFMPSYNELFPMTILEAVNCHKPLLLRDLDLYHDILFDKYLSGKNNKEFVNLINELKDDKKLYQKQSKNSKEISEFYSKENILKIWKEFYTKIYNEHKEKVEN